MNHSFLKKINLDTYIAFDFETTGLDPGHDRVIEFAGVRFEQGEPRERLTLLCNPGFEISEEIQLLTGISNAMISGKVCFEEHLGEVIDFIGKIPLVAHNISFDLAFLKAAIYRQGGYKAQRLPRHIYDTLLLARTFFFYLHDFTLGTVAEYCGLSTAGAHRAEADALTTGKIMLRLVEEAQRYDFKTLQTLNRILAGTQDPNQALFQDLAQVRTLRKSLSKSPVPDIDWQARKNQLGTLTNRDGKPLKTKDFAADYFGEKGELAAQLSGFEFRPQQSKMATLVLDSLRNGRVALLEAGTGVGKSLAYLLPSVYWLTTQKEQVRLVVASNTKALQEQIFYKEIPFIQHNLQLPFKAVLLKGRQNYICLTRWYRLLNDLSNRVPISERSAILPLVIWLKHTRTGDISENNGFSTKRNWRIWNEICSEPGYCTTNVCKQYQGCFLGKIRQEAHQADVLVINHSLLLSNAATENKVIPEYSDLIIDEAHNLEKNASQFFAAFITLPAITFLLDKLHSSGKHNTGLLNDLLNLGQHIEEISKLQTTLESIKVKIEETRLTAAVFFKHLAAIKKADPAPNQKIFGLKERFKQFCEHFPGIKDDSTEFQDDLTELIPLITRLTERLGEFDADQAKVVDEIQTDLKASLTEIEAYQHNLNTIVQSDDENLIFWVEMAGSGKEKSVVLACTPLAIGDYLYEYLFNQLHSVILTSATLRVGDSFTYLLKRLGVAHIDSQKVSTQAVGSPFKFQEQVQCFTYHMTAGKRSDKDGSANLLIRLAQETRRGMLVLFTSYTALNSIYKAVYPTFRNMGTTLLAQGFGSSRMALLDRFRLEKSSVLLGTTSFWEGVDVIGESLQILVIDKLPFAVPTEPIIEANAEKIKLAGGNPFFDYYVPESVLKFRQGIGRLIRSSSDRGVIINLDTRIDKKSYGRLFKTAFPVEPQTIVGADQLIQAVTAFLK